MRDTTKKKIHQQKKKFRFCIFKKNKYTRVFVLFVLVNVSLTLYAPQIQSNNHPESEQPLLACFEWYPPEPITGENIMFDASCSFHSVSFFPEQHIYQNHKSFNECSEEGCSKIDESDFFFNDNNNLSEQDDQHGLYCNNHHGLGMLSEPYMLEHLQIDSYLWEFGDGSISTEPNPTHKYEEAGTYNVSLTITDDMGRIDTAYGCVIVRHNPSACIDLISPQQAISGTPVLFVGHGVDGSEGGFLINYSWISSIDGLLSTQPTFSTSNLSHGIHHIVFKVQNNSGIWSEPAEDTLTINTPPKADAGGPYFGWVNEPIVFNGSKSTDTDGVIAEYLWDFGDGTTGLGQHFNHTYTNIGLYTVSLTVIDDLGGKDIDTTVARIVGCVVANAGGPYSGYTNSSMHFNGSGSYDVAGNITTYEWDFGDGTSGTGETPTHMYQSVGTYNITLRVTNENGQQDTDITTATIRNNLQPSAPEIYGVTQGEIQREYVFQIRSYDPEGDMISYIVDWGDTTTFTSPFFPSGTMISTSHVWKQPGTYTIRVLAKDNNTSVSETTTFTINISQDNSFYSQKNNTQTHLPFLAFIYGIIEYLTARSSTENQLMIFGIISVTLLIAVIVFFWFKQKRL